MEWALGISVVINVILAIFLAAFLFGMGHIKEELEDNIVLNGVMTPNEIRDSMKGPPGPAGMPGPKGDRGPKGPPGPAGLGAETYQVNDHQTLAEWIAYIEGRIKRVEKKAGMSV